MGADLQEACEAIETIGEELDLTLTLAQHHEKAEHLLVKVAGKRQHVHEVPLYLLNHCPFVHIELLAAEHTNHLYRMTFAISAREDEDDIRDPEDEPDTLFKAPNNEAE